MSESTLPNLIFGVIAIGVGISIVRYRKKLNERVYESQRRMFGRRASRLSAGRQPHFTMGIVGVAAIIIGGSVVLLAVARMLLETGP